MAATTNVLRFKVSLVIMVLLSTKVLSDDPAETNSTSTISTGAQQITTSTPQTTVKPKSTTPTPPIYCDGQPKQISNAHANVTDTQVNATAVYTCNSGYQLYGNNSVRCQSDGHWQEPEATCTITDCHQPNNITHGNVRYTNTTVNSTAEYRCDTGYQLNGTAIVNITCQANGSWSDLLANCTVTVHGYNESCEQEQQCSTHNAFCRSFDEYFRCRCGDDHYYHQGNNSCLKRIAYQQLCKLNGSKEQCKTVNASCLKDGRCLCTEDNYYDLDSDSCKPRPMAPIGLEFEINFGPVTTHSLYVEWTGGSKNDIGKYTSYVKWEPPSESNESDFKKNWSNIGNHYTVENLFSGTNYTFYLYLRSMGHRTKLLSTASAFTKPLPIHKLHLEYIGERNTTIEWRNDPGLPCTSYEVSINGGQVVPVQRDGNTSNYSFNDLTGGTSYTVDVTSVVPGQKSKPFTTKFYTRPEPVTSANVTQVNSSSLIVQLINEGKKEDESYHLHIYPKTSEENMTVTSDNETITIGDLHPGTLYTVQIYTFYQSLESEHFVTITEYTRPLSPENLTATKILEKSLELQWAMADDNFDEYILEYSALDNMENITIRISNTSIQNYLIRNLTSGIGYSFLLYSAINGTKSLEPATYEVYTKPSGPNNPKLTLRMDTSISIQFPDDNNSYTSYKIDGQLYDRNNGYITIQNLTAGLYHNFTIFTVANYTELSLDNITYKDFTLPGPPSNVMFPNESLHETSLTVKWENVTEGNVNGYFVLFTDEDSIIREFNDTSFANFAVYTNLTAGVRYNVTIYSFWNGERSYRTLEGSTYTRPPAPEVAITGVTETTLTLDFTDDLWEGYMIIVNPSAQNDTDRLEFIPEKMPYEIRDLVAGTEYTIEVFSMIGGIVGENGRQVSSYTKPDRVSIDSILADKNETNISSLALTWKKPGMGSVDWYEFEIMCTSPNGPEILMLNFTRRTNETNALVWGLEPGTFCTVNITTHVGNQTGAMTQKRVEWSTDETAPEQVQDVNIETGARSLKLTWSKPKKPNGIIRKYAVDVIDLKQNCSFSRTLFTCTNCPETSDPNCGKESDYDPWTVDHCNESSPVYNRTFEDIDTLDYNVTDLHPYRDYRVVVTPFSRCYGNLSSVYNRTKEDVPSGEPTHVELDSSNTTADSLSISWMPPEEDFQNGIITHYTVYFRYKNRTCFGDGTGNEVMENFTLIAIYGTNILTANRYPYWPYEVTISAWTKVGEGPKTKPLTVMTKESTPDAIRSPPTVVHTFQFRIELHWESPCFINGIIKHYRIQVFNDSFEVVKDFTTTSNETQQIVDGLYPYHNYTMSVSSVNMGGQEGPAVNTSKVARTMTGVPYKPTDVKAEANSSESIHVNWQTPELYTGITWYHVTAKDTQDSTKQHTVVSGSNFYLDEIYIDGLEAFWNYTVTVTAVTSAGHNVSETSSVVRTEEAAPGNVGSLKLDAEENVTQPRSIKVTWTDPKPRDLNGILTAFYVTYTDVSQTDNVAVTQEIEVQNKSFIIHDIVPGSYDVGVFASTIAGNGSTVLENIPVPPGAPIKNKESANDPLLKESTTSSPSETQIPIQLPTDFLCDQRNGEPKSFGLIVAADTQATDKPFLGSKDDFDVRLKTYKTWFEINGMEKPPPYITTATDWNPCKKRRKRSTDGQSESFTIGTQGDCAGVAAGTYCNGKLKSGTSYRVKAFSCTDGGCAETIYSKVIKTEVGEPEEPVNLVIPIVGGVLAALVVSAVTIGTVLYLRRRQAACFAKSAEDGYTHRRSEPIQATELAERNSSSKVFSRPKYSPSPCLVRLSEFPDYVDKQKKDSGLLFSEAYKMIKENSPQHPTSIAESQVCRPKNRYTNILPFDYSRVKLLPLDDEEGTDYINANYIPGYTSRREYIATQGPMPSTFDDFWRMVWEQNVEIIVMLTKLVEKGRNKCDKYWPNQNEPQFYGDLSVSVMSESNLSDYTIRIMELKLGCKLRKVKHFHFLKWPDYGCPSRTWPIINFIAMVRQYRPPFSSGPLLVHCSAGVGRTGTFIAVDHLLQHIRDHDEIDIYNLVLEMRNNRCNMVQTEDQYIYIHECIREFISNDDQEDDYDDEDDHIYTNTQQENVYENTGFARPF